jgi:hypothetical protein
MNGSRDRIFKFPGLPPASIVAVRTDIRGPMVQPVDFYGPLVIMSSSDGRIDLGDREGASCPISEANEQALEVAS